MATDMPRSLILGVNGQDGSFMAEAMLRRGHHVTGVGRDPVSRYVEPSDRFRYLPLDLRDEKALVRAVAEAEPDFAFHFAAVHGAAGFQYEPVWRDMLAVNVSSLHVLLEHARVVAPHMRVVYAGSAKIFPTPLVGEIDETTPAASTCLYSIGKIASRDLIMQYRKNHGARATNLILFNHDSPRRPPQFILPMIAHGLAQALADPAHRFTLRTLDFRIDWSAADELCDIAADIAERSDEGEFVLASGKTWVARDAVRELFADYGLDAERHVVESVERSQPGPAFHVSLDRLRRAIGRVPKRTLREIVAEMISTPPSAGRWKRG